MEIHFEDYPIRKCNPLIACSFSTVICFPINLHWLCQWMEVLNFSYVLSKHSPGLDKNKCGGATNLITNNINASQFCYWPWRKGSGAHHIICCFKSSYFNQEFIFFLRKTKWLNSSECHICLLFQDFGWREAVPIYIDNGYGEGIIPYLTDALQAVGASSYRLPECHFSISHKWSNCWGAIQANDYANKFINCPHVSFSWLIQKFQQDNPDNVDADKNIYGLHWQRIWRGNHTLFDWCFAGSSSYRLPPQMIKLLRSYTS